MKKSEIRKKIIKLRKKNYSKDININFQSIIKILRKKKYKKKLLVDIIHIIMKQMLYQSWKNLRN